MTRDDIRATLEKQLQLLSERSAKETGAALAVMSEAMEHISEFLFRTSRSDVIRVEVDRQKMFSELIEEMRDKHAEGHT